MLNEGGYVFRGVTGRQNIFIVRTAVTYTAPISAGSTAAEFHPPGWWLDIYANSGLPLQGKPSSRYDIFTSGRMLLTTPPPKVIAASKLDTRLIGTGKNPAQVTGSIFIQRIPRKTDASRTGSDLQVGDVGNLPE